MIFQRFYAYLKQFLQHWRWRRLRRAHLRLGRFGERSACHLLENTGCEILCRNYRSGKNEIDIVVREDGVLCFVEVKTRHYKPGIRPAEAVNAEKRHHILRGARRYLREIGSPEVAIRFDIVEVITGKRGIREIRHGKNAFREK